MLHQLRIVITDISRNFPPYKIRFLKRFILRGKLYFGNRQPFIFPVELVHFENMLPAAHQITGLIDDARLAQPHQVFGLIQRDLLFPFVAADA